MTAVAFALIIATGLLGQSGLFMGAVFLLGLGGGLMTVSNLSFMLDMTVPQAAGLYVGAWSVANFAGQAVGNVIGGMLSDIFSWLTGNPLAGYAAVFSLEIVGLPAGGVAIPIDLCRVVPPPGRSSAPYRSLPRHRLTPNSASRCEQAKQFHRCGCGCARCRSSVLYWSV